MKLIPLTKGYFAKVDDEDFDRLSAFKWQVSRIAAGVTVLYAKRGEWINGKMVTRLMHKDITGAANYQEIDHVDLDGLNNQKSNLRFATAVQNCQNRKTRKHANPFKGVHFHKRIGKYQAAITVNKSRKHLGYFEKAEDGAIAYDCAAIKYFGEFSRTNKQMGVLSEI